MTATTSGQPSDRRVRKSRRSIRDALVALCAEREFGTLSVEDVLERADVARATFYAHYRGKEDVLVDVARVLAEDRATWMEKHELRHPEGFTGDLVRVIFEHAEEHREVYTVILRGAGDGRALREFYDQTSQWAEQFFSARAAHAGVAPPLPVDIVARAWAGELIGTLGWWLSGGSGYSAQRIAGTLNELAKHGRRWASGAGPEGEPVAPAADDEG